MRSVEFIDVKVLNVQVQFFLTKFTGSDGLQVRTRADFGAEPFLNAVLVHILQAASALAGLDQRVGTRLLPHLTDSAQITLFLIRVLQQQAKSRKEVWLKSANLIVNICSYYTKCAQSFRI